MSRIIFLVAVSHRWFWAGTAIVGPAVQLSATDHDLTAAFGAECQCSGEGAVQTAERCQPPSTNIHSPVMYPAWREQRSEEHTSELQSLMRRSYAVFCLKKKNRRSQRNTSTLPPII